MGNVILFGKLKKNMKEFNQNKKKSKIATEKATKGCPKVLDSLREGSSIDINYADMEPDEKIEYWKNIEKEEEERFQCIVNAFSFCAIQYFLYLRKTRKAA